MYSQNNKNKSGFPDPLESRLIKEGKEYGLRFAKAILAQWGSMGEDQSLIRKRSRIFHKNRRYANGTQDTSIYKQILTSLDPSNSDGSLLNLDFSPVPILPKFVRIVVNKILSKDPYPNLEAVDPLSSSEKDKQRRKVEMMIRHKEQLQALQKQTGVQAENIDAVPETLEEAEIFMDNNIKSSSEIAAQIATNLTLEWNDFSDKIYRRCVEDLVTLGMAVVKRSNDPNYGIAEEYVDPETFVHSYTEDAGMNDLIYAGHLKSMPIHELKRIAGDQLTEEDFAAIARKAQKKYGYDSSKLHQTSYDII